MLKQWHSPFVVTEEICVIGTNNKCEYTSLLIILFCIFGKLYRIK
jgi:hypothetical protein